MRSAAQFTISTRDRDFEEFRLREIRRERLRKIALELAACVLWLVLTAALVFVCCAVSGYHWE